MQLIMTIKQKKVVNVVFALIAIILLVSFCVEPIYANKLTSKLGGGAGAADIVSKVDEGGFQIVDTIRKLSVVAAVIFIVWAGIIFWGAGGDPRKLSEAKSKLIWFFVAMVFIFMAENIFATLSSFFNLGEYVR